MARAQLISAAQTELDGTKPEVIDQLWDWLHVVFEKWKYEHGKRTPTRRPAGILGQEEPVPFDQASPWQCAGFNFPSRMLLFNKLHVENYPEVVTIISKVGIRRVLAVLIVRSEDESLDNLLFAYELLNGYRDLDRLDQFLPLAEKVATHSKNQSARASLDRKLKPTPEQLLSFQDQYLAKYGQIRGWKKAACSEFNLSDKTLNNILKNLPE